MTTTTTRRAILAGAAALPALAAPSMTAAAASPPAAAAPSIDPDAELRRLWAQYCSDMDAYNAAAAVHAPRRAAYDQDLEPFHNLVGDVDERYSPWGGWQGWIDAQHAASKKAWRKHKLGGPWRFMNKFHERCGATIKAIRLIEARTPFGVGIKLAALPADRDLLDNVDYVEALQSALPDLDKLCGGSFANSSIGGVNEVVQS